MDPITIALGIALLGFATNRRRGGTVDTLDIVGEARYNAENFTSGRTRHHGIEIVGHPESIATCVEALDYIQDHTKSGVSFVQRHCGRINLVELEWWGQCRPGTQIFGNRSIDINESLSVGDMATTIVHECQHMADFGLGGEASAERAEELFAAGELKADRGKQNIQPDLI